MLPVADVSPDPQQPRKRFPASHIQNLADSIETRGLLQAIIVRPWPKDRGRPITPYMLVAGECRWRAHKLLERDKIKCSIRTDLDERETRLLAIIENVQRADMNPMEEARAYQQLVDNGFTVADIIKELGLKSTNAVRSRLDLLALRPDIQQLVESGNMPSSIAWGIAQAPKQFQIGLLRDFQSGKLKTQEAMRHAGAAIKQAAAQVDIFASAPKPSKRDVERLNAMESRIAEWVKTVDGGFKNGEVVAAQRVNPNRVEKMADQMALIRKHLTLMEADLRRVAVQRQVTMNL